MNMKKAEIFQGKKIEISEMILNEVDNKLVLSWKICLENTVFGMVFSNVSRLRIGEVSAPIEIQGFEIIDHSQNGWDKDSLYEIRDFEDDRVSFFCERFEMYD